MPSQREAAEPLDRDHSGQNNRELKITETKPERIETENFDPNLIPTSPEPKFARLIWILGSVNQNNQSL